ncbi:MAG: recombinase family protein, partial [Singulisphaera sp.]
GPAALRRPRPGPGRERRCPARGRSMPETPRPLVAYYRVSTREQGASGLGLEGQVLAVDLHARATGRPLLRSFKEVESGKSSGRPQLAKALAHAKRAGATLIVAKLDRLSRNVAFLSTLMEGGVDFVCCDNPHANTFTCHILAAVAEFEAKAISERTKAALAAYKARGGKLGSHLVGCRLTPADREKGSARGGKASRTAAVREYGDLLPQILAWKREGLSLRAIAGRLNEEGHSTRKGAPSDPCRSARSTGPEAGPINDAARPWVIPKVGRMASRRRSPRAATPQCTVRRGQPPRPPAIGPGGVRPPFSPPDRGFQHHARPFQHPASTMPAPCASVGCWSEYPKPT